MDSLHKKNDLLISIMCLCILLPLFCISVYNRPCADDYDYSLLHTILLRMEEAYLHWLAVLLKPLRSFIWHGRGYTLLHFYFLFSLQSGENSIMHLLHWSWWVAYLHLYSVLYIYSIGALSAKRFLLRFALRYAYLYSLFSGCHRLWKVFSGLMEQWIIRHGLLRMCLIFVCYWRLRISFRKEGDVCFCCFPVYWLFWRPEPIMWQPLRIYCFFWLLLYGVS